MELVDASEEYSEICRPSGETLPARVLACLSRGLEAVMVPDYDGVLCAAVSRGRFFLDAAAQKRVGSAPYLPAESIKLDELCATDRPSPDKRLIPRSLIKDLVRKSGVEIDPRGVRIIGGVYCEGLELSGVDMPFSLALDKSVFTCTSSTECRRSPIDIRNFRTKGDLSLDYIASHVSIRITRSDIAGSLYGQGAFFEKFYVGDSTIRGSVNLYDSFIVEEMTVENTKIEGHVDFSRNFFSHLVLIAESYRRRAGHWTNSRKVQLRRPAKRDRRCHSCRTWLRGRTEGAGQWRGTFRPQGRRKDGRPGRTVWRTWRADDRSCRCRATNLRDGTFNRAGIVRFYRESRPALGVPSRFWLAFQRRGRHGSQYNLSERRYR